MFSEPYVLWVLCFQGSLFSCSLFLIWGWGWAWCWGGPQVPHSFILTALSLQVIMFKLFILQAMCFRVLCSEGSMFPDPGILFFFFSEPCVLKEPSVCIVLRIWFMKILYFRQYVYMVLQYPCSHGPMFWRLYVLRIHVLKAQCSKGCMFTGTRFSELYVYVMALCS